jgi:hypothetical protein
MLSVRYLGGLLGGKVGLTWPDVASDLSAGRAEAAVAGAVVGVLTHEVLGHVRVVRDQQDEFSELRGASGVGSVIGRHARRFA